MRIAALWGLGLVACGAKARVQAPVESIVFAADGTAAVVGSARGDAVRVDTKGRAKALPVTDVRRWTLSTDGKHALGAAKQGFVVVELDTGKVDTIAVSERDGEPWQLFRTPKGDIAVTRLSLHWRVHRWMNGTNEDPEPTHFDDLQAAWVDEGGEVYFLDTGFGLQVRDVATGRIVRTIDRRSDPQRYVDATLDADRRLVTALWDGDGFRLWAPPDAPGGLWNLAEDAPFDLGANGGLAAVGADVGIEIRSSSGQVQDLVPTKQKVVAVALSDDGKTVVGALADGTIVVEAVSVPPSPVTDRPASGVDPGRIDPERMPGGGAVTPPQQSHALPEPPRLVRWAPAGKLQGWIGQDLVSVDPFTGIVESLGIKKLASGREFAWKRDMSTLAVMEEGGIALYSPGRKAFLRLGKLDTGGSHSFMGWGGDHIVVDVDATKVQAWSTETGQPIGDPFQVAGRVLTGFSVSPDGTRLATVGEDAAVYDVVARKQLTRLDGHLGRVSGVAWSIDGKQLASVGNDGTVILWDVGSFEPKALYEGLMGQSVAFSPDGRMLLVAGATQARVVDLDTGAETLTLGFQGTLTSADWGEIGMVLTTSANMLYVWP